MGLFSIFKKSNVLYFPGCITYFKHKDIFELYQNIFDRLDIEFRIIDKKICCGIHALEAGYDNEARKLARRNFEIFKEEEITKIITNSPCCYKMFSQDYSMLLPEWNIDLVNLWEVILEKLEERPGLIKNKADDFETVGYQDSCYLGRYSNIYDEPRKILKMIGCNLKEIPDTKQETICCGSCGGLPDTNPKLADDIAKERIMQAKRAGIKKIVVSSLKDYELLKKNSVDSGIDIIELGEVLGLALGIIKHRIKEEANEKIEEREILSETEANMKIEEELKEEDYYDKVGEGEDDN